MRDVATCPELSYECLHAPKDSDNQSKPLSSNIEGRTDSAPAMLPVPHPAENRSDKCQLSASVSVPGVGRAHVTFTVASPGQPVQCYRDAVNTGGNRNGACGGVSCQDVSATGTVVSARPQPLSDAVIQPPVGHVTETVTQLPQSLANSDAGTVTADADANAAAAAARLCLKRPHDEAAESAALTDVETNFACHEVTECSDKTIGNVSSGVPVVAEPEADLMGSPSKLTACNTMLVDQDSRMSLLSETDGGETGHRTVFGAVQLAVVDESVDMSDALLCHPESTTQPMVVAVDEGSNISVTMDDELGQLLATVEDVGDRTLSCSSAVYDCSSNDDSRCTMDGIPLVSSSCLCYNYFI